MSSVLVSSMLFCIIAASYFRIGYGQTTFNVLDYDAAGDGQRDDSEAFLKAWKALCAANEGDKGTPRLIIPAKKKFLFQPIKLSGPCKSNSVHVEILGKVVAPKTPNAWKECVESWISFSSVTNLIISGAGEINGQGSRWWTRDSNLNHGNKARCQRPKALGFSKCNNLQLSGLTLADSPKGHISIDSCHNGTVSYLHIRAPKDSPNTDGIDISKSSHLNIHDCNIGTGDDCIAINSGSSHINITNIACGPGHGISVGSLGKNGAYATAEEIHVRNCSFNGTLNGARIKTWQGASGYARKISFEQITLIETSNPIIIDQYYCNGRHDCKNLTSTLNVSDVTYNGFHGTSKNEKAITFDCATLGCVNIVMNQINITSAIPNKETQASCSNVNGTSRATAPQVPCLQIY
ncbi:hypothetical protein M0R45_032179 [Rubus argutus]|uniref:endo-polygalacturonase n=1 Tax=Rubus argutus TaxID=59490 RepID=A0AAW1WI00_RUBAR